MQEQRNASYALTQEGTSYLESGSPEAQVFAAIPAEGIAQPQLIVCYLIAVPCSLAPNSFSLLFSKTCFVNLQQKLGNVGSVGVGQAMKLKWIVLDKSGGQPVAKRKVQLS